MIGTKERAAGAALAAVGLSQLLFKSLVKSGAISKADADEMLVRAAAECNTGHAAAQKYAWYLLAEMRDWLDKQPDA